MTELERNLGLVQERMAAAARRAGRNPAEVTLVAVTKGQPVGVIRSAYDLGLRQLGENRVGEAEEKVGALPPDISWHMIGHIQSRKASRVVPLFQIVHSIDRSKIAQGLDRSHPGAEPPLRVLLEMNVSGEESKYGFAASRWESDATQRRAFFAAIDEILSLPNLRVQGLMTMAPVVADAEAARPHFARLRGLRDELARTFPGTDWHHLSMGMTDDFEVAIEEGATMVRIGRAIFAPELPAWRTSYTR